MPLLIIIVIVWLLFKPKRTRTASKRITYSVPHQIQPTAPVVYDPIKAQKEQDRQQDRARKQAEQDRKRREQEAKRAEEKQAARDRIEWTGAMIDKYSALYEQIETELTENPRLTAYKQIQLQKQLLQLEEKIHKYKEQQDKAYFIANS